MSNDERAQSLPWRGNEGEANNTNNLRCVLKRLIVSGNNFGNWDFVTSINIPFDNTAGIDRWIISTHKKETNKKNYLLGFTYKFQFFL